MGQMIPFDFDQTPPPILYPFACFEVVCNGINAVTKDVCFRDK